MPVMDEFREERESIKNSSFKKKLQYFLDYYKWYVIIGVIVIMVVTSIITEIANNKEAAFFGFFLNTYCEKEEETAFVNDFATKAQLDTEEYDVLIDSSLRISVGTVEEYTMATMNRILVSLTAGDLDFIGAEPATFEHYVFSNTFCDLSTLLTPQQMETYKDYIYYADLAEIRNKLNWDSMEEYVIKEYDPRDPDSMAEPVPVGLYILDAPKIASVYKLPEGELIMGIPANAPHKETILKFIDYIYEK